MADSTDYDQYNDGFQVLPLFDGFVDILNTGLTGLVDVLIFIDNIFYLVHIFLARIKLGNGEENLLSLLFQIFVHQDVRRLLQEKIKGNYYNYKWYQLEDNGESEPVDFEQVEEP